MIIKKFAYPYDQQGTNPECLVPNEKHTITPINGVGIGFIVPKAAPFFRRSVVLKHVESGKVLTDGVDWAPSHHFEAASTQKPYLEIFGSLVILDTTLSGTFELVEYQTLGGEFTLDETALLELLANTSIDPRTTTWDKVVYAPAVFDPLAHLQSISDTYGYEELVAAVNNLTDKLIVEYGKLGLAYENHVADQSNPHGVDANTVALSRFLTVYRATLEQVLAGTDGVNYITADNLHRKLELSISDLDMNGKEGEVVYYDASGKNFGTVAGLIQNKMGIVHSIAEWNKQITSRESFEDVFNTWRRIAMTNNNPIAIPGELEAWEYNSSTDTLRSTVNSSSVVGLLSPDLVSGDYVFEVEVSSINSDDDWIGISLGTWMSSGKLRHLTLMRSASNQTTSPTAAPSLVLEYDKSAPSAKTLASITGLNVPVGGWGEYTQPVKIRARRVGTVIYITTTEPGGAYLPEVSFDLASDSLYLPASKEVSLGYVAHSQLHASWKTIARTGAQVPVVGMHDNSVAEWNGSSYVVGSKQPSDLIKRGRFYRNSYTSRSYFAEGNGVPVMVSNKAGMKELSEAGNYKDVVLYSDSSGQVHNGHAFISHYNDVKRGSFRVDATKVGIADKNDNWFGYFTDDGTQHVGSMTQYYLAGTKKGGVKVDANYVGFSKADGGFHGYFDSASNWHMGEYLYLYSSGAKRGGIRATSTAVGITKADGSWYGYFDSAGIFQHWGVNHKSDVTLKTNITEAGWVDDREIRSMSWDWACLESIPKDRWGNEDMGVIAQVVEKYYPHCVSLDEETSLLSVDYSKLAVLMFLNERIKPNIFVRCWLRVKSLL